MYFANKHDNLSCLFHKYISLGIFKRELTLACDQALFQGLKGASGGTAKASERADKGEPPTIMQSFSFPPWTLQKLD